VPVRSEPLDADLTGTQYALVVRRTVVLRTVLEDV
jgi:hypothetical protein